MMDKVSDVRCFGGQQQRFRHFSTTLGCDMVFAIYLPPQLIDKSVPTVPMLLWLSGLTCTDENFVTKAGAQRYAAEHGVAIIAPDTSPRGEHIPDDPDNAYDFGLGAGFYVDATEPPWNTNYQMYSYITEELTDLVCREFAMDGGRQSIFGHSMGGHGALMIALKNPNRFTSVSAFSPIVSPTTCPWGIKALGLYLGDNLETHKQYDSCHLLTLADTHIPLLIDQGDADEFLQEQLQTETFIDQAQQVGYPITVNMREGYDHSYFFISSFIGEHIAFHVQHLASK